MLSAAGVELHGLTGLFSLVVCWIAAIVDVVLHGVELHGSTGMASLFLSIQSPLQPTTQNRSIAQNADGQL